MRNDPLVISPGLRIFTNHTKITLPPNTPRMDTNQDFARLSTKPAYSNPQAPMMINPTSTPISEHPSSAQGGSEIQAKPGLSITQLTSSPNHKATDLVVTKSLTIEPRSPKPSIRRKPLPRDSIYSPANSPRNSVFPLSDLSSSDSLPLPETVETVLLPGTKSELQDSSEGYSPIPLGRAPGSELGFVSKNGYKPLELVDMENHGVIVRRGRWSALWGGRGLIVVALTVLIVFVIVAIPAIVGLSRFNGDVSD